MLKPYGGMVANWIDLGVVRRKLASHKGVGHDIAKRTRWNCWSGNRLTVLRPPVVLYEEFVALIAGGPMNEVVSDEVDGRIDDVMGSDCGTEPRAGWTTRQVDWVKVVARAGIVEDGL